MKTPLQHIGDSVRRLREFRNLTQDALAEKAGVRAATISDIENGKANFEIETMIKLASALQVVMDISFYPVEYQA